MTRKFLFVGTLLVVMLILAACGTAAEPVYDADEVVADAQEDGETSDEHAEAVATEETVLEEATATSIPPTETIIPPTDTPEPTAVPTEEEAAFGSDDPLYEAVTAADPANGEQLFSMNACMGCHTIDASEMVVVGPGQYNVISRAAESVEGEGPYTYLYNSIVNPDAHVVEGFAPSIMPPNFGDMLSDEQIYDLVAYLATLHD